VLFQREPLRRTADTLELFHAGNGNASGTEGWKSENKHRYSPLVFDEEGSGAKPPAAGVPRNSSANRVPHQFAWPIQYGASMVLLGRMLLSFVLCFILAVQHERPQNSDSSVNDVPEDRLLVPQELAGVRGHVKSNVPLHFAWPVQQGSVSRVILLRCICSCCLVCSAVEDNRANVTNKSRNVDGRDSEYHASFLAEAPEQVIVHRKASPDSFSLFNNDPAVETEGAKPFQSETSAQYTGTNVSNNVARSTDTLPVAGARLQSAANPRNFAWPIEPGQFQRIVHMFHLEMRC
jgi:hypothetical protein